MEEFKIVVGVATGFMAIIGVFTYFESRTIKQNEKDTEMKMMQVNATHENTLQMQALTHELKTMGNAVNNHGQRIENLEDYVFKGDRPHFAKDRV